MMIQTDIKYIVTDPEVLGGRPFIAGHRIGVIHVATWIQQGKSPQEIVRDYDITLAEIYAALTYYYDHQAEIDVQAATDDARLLEYATQDHSPLAETVRAQWQERLAQGDISSESDGN